MAGTVENMLAYEVSSIFSRGPSYVQLRHSNETVLEEIAERLLLLTRALSTVHYIGLMKQFILLRKIFIDGLDLCSGLDSFAYQAVQAEPRKAERAY